MFEHITLTTSVLTSMLTTAIAPVTLIGGIAFLVSIMAGRYARCIDRIRTLLKDIQELPSPNPRREHVKMQVRILYSRTRSLRSTMTLAACSIFCIVLTVCCSFLNLMFQFPSAFITALTFMIALALLVAAVTGFIKDLLISLRAVKIEIRSSLDL